MRLLYLGPPENQKDIQTNLPKEFEVCFATTESEAEKYLSTADVILDAYMKVRFPKERLSKAPQLKLVITATTGADHIDAVHLASRGIPLLTLKGQQEFLRNITPAAEHSWLLLMACARQLRAAIREVDEKQWDRNKFPGIMLRGKTIGIVGCGRIGQWMATYATAFGMKCLGFDPFVSDWPAKIEKVELDVLLSSSDFVSVHVPLSTETKLLLGAKQFARMKPGVVLVNSSRGEVIDESALLTSLKEGKVAAAGLDVLTGEPDIADHPLVKYAKDHLNVIITPHIAGFSPEALQHVLRFSCQRILDFFSDSKNGNRPLSSR